MNVTRDAAAMGTLPNGTSWLDLELVADAAGAGGGQGVPRVPGFVTPIAAVSRRLKFHLTTGHPYDGSRRASSAIEGLRRQQMRLGVSLRGKLARSVNGSTGNYSAAWLLFNVSIRNGTPPHDHLHARHADG